MGNKRLLNAAYKIAKQLDDLGWSDDPAVVKEGWEYAGSVTVHWEGLSNWTTNDNYYLTEETCGEIPYNPEKSEIFKVPKGYSVEAYSSCILCVYKD